MVLANDEIQGSDKASIGGALEVVGFNLDIYSISIIFAHAPPQHGEQLCSSGFGRVVLDMRGSEWILEGSFSVESYV